MAIAILQEKQNNSMRRKDTTVQIEFSGPTPKKDDITKMLASKFGCDQSLVSIKKISSGYGSQKAEVIARIYGNTEDLNRLEKVRKYDKKAAATQVQDAEEKKE